ncbi:uncharacterized protein BCR38DRAFT_484738 [Pseudomassariella vexata]|uniref:Uncharacterized protein n=1 Tax=Pseudomassariella vexata TaxID=1141098 RepID=A0A1Y2E1V0_9PEZI|nr:uncharacterized protein BCR38DRAFT_484738 [Pseudomassariella vexata]ORY65296.1 hypothetical protein BCR38DRAFT_484738 [Pseudomassariella vexata]
MDGPTSRLPSIVTPYLPPGVPGARPGLADRRSNKDFYFSGLPSSAPPTSTYGVDPPRPAKEGYEWVWFPEGYWAERERHDTPSSYSTGKPFKWRKRSAKGSSSRETDSTGWQVSPKSAYGNRVGIDESSNAPLPSPYLTEEAHVQSLQRPRLYRMGFSEDNTRSLPLVRLQQVLSNGTQPSSPLSNVTVSDSTTPQAGVPSSTERTSRPGSSLGILSPKRSMGKTPPKSPGSPNNGLKRSFMGFWSRAPAKTTAEQAEPTDVVDTDATVEAAKQQLKQSTSCNPISRISSLLRDETKSPQSQGKPRQRKLFGKSPWYRKASHGSENSVSSSIRDILRGLTPMATPTSETGANRRNSRDWTETYPGGEARRIKTPPLRASTADRPCRSFFFDINRAPQTASSPLTPPEEAALKCPSKRATKSEHTTKEWWEVPLATMRWEDLGPKSFEFDLPEHLPNSPMCPANKKHKSGGTGVCVYHGRRKRSSTLEGSEADPARDDVFNSGNEQPDP